MKPSLRKPAFSLLLLLLPFLRTGYSAGTDELGAFPCFEGVKLRYNPASLVAHKKSSSANILMQSPGDYAINAPTASTAARGCAELCQGAPGCDVFITFPAPDAAAVPGFPWRCVLLKEALLKQNITDFDIRVPQSYSCTLSDSTFTKSWGDFYGKAVRNAQSGQPIFCAPFTNVNANNIDGEGDNSTAAKCFEKCIGTCTVTSYFHFKKDQPEVARCTYRNQPNGDGKGHGGQGDTGLFNPETFVDGITCYKQEADLLRVGQLLSASNARSYVYKGTRYNLYPDKVTKVMADKACKAAGGQLASIDPEDRQLMEELNENLLSHLAPQHLDGCAGARRMAFIALQQKPAAGPRLQPTYVMGDGATAKIYTSDQLSSVLDTSITPEVQMGQQATAGVLQTCQGREKEPKVHFALVDGAKTCCVAAFICTGPEPPLFSNSVQPGPSGSQTSGKLGVIVGIVVGAAVGVAILVAGGVWLTRHLKKKRQDKKWDDVLKT